MLLYIDLYYTADIKLHVIVMMIQEFHPQIQFNP